LSEYWQKLKSASILGGLSLTSAVFPLSPALSPLLWLASPLYRRANDVLQGAATAWYLSRSGMGLKRSLGTVGGLLLGREGVRAGLTEHVLRHTPLAGRYGQ
jgi:hypothetical protein